jgi:hypothetical protein
VFEGSNPSLSAILRCKRCLSFKLNRQRLIEQQEGFEPQGSTKSRSDSGRAQRARRASAVARVNPSLSADNRLSYGGSRLHLRDDLPRTPSGPEGSSGRGIKSGAEVLLARVAS